MEYEDKEIVCVDCKESFIFTAGEQEFFESKNLTPPRRCKNCRMKKRMAKLNQENQDNEKNY